MARIVCCPSVPVHAVVGAVAEPDVVGVLFEAQAGPEVLAALPIARAYAPHGVRVGVVGVMSGDDRLWGAVRLASEATFSPDRWDAARAWANAGSRGGPPEVLRDPDLEPILDEYLADRRASAASLVAAAQAEQWEAVRRVAHQFRGTGVSYGFPVFTALGGLLEWAIGERRHDLARDGVAAYAHYVARVRWA